MPSRIILLKDHVVRQDNIKNNWPKPDKLIRQYSYWCLQPSPRRISFQPPKLRTAIPLKNPPTSLKPFWNSKSVRYNVARIFWYRDSKFHVQDKAKPRNQGVEPENDWGYDPICKESHHIYVFKRIEYIVDESVWCDERLRIESITFQHPFIFSASRRYIESDNQPSRVCFRINP